MMGEDQSEGSGGSGAGQDGEALVKPDAMPPALSGPASSSAVTNLPSMCPQCALSRPLRESNVTPKLTA